MKIRHAMLAALFSIFVAHPTLALDDAHRVKARQVLDKAFGYLKSKQTAEGAWSPKPGPAVTGLVTAAILRDEKLGKNDPTAQKGIAYILTRQKPTGGI